MQKSKSRWIVSWLVIILSSAIVVGFFTLKPKSITGGAGSDCLDTPLKKALADAKIALDNKDIKELYDAVAVGTHVVIQPGGARGGK